MDSISTKYTCILCRSFLTKLSSQTIEVSFPMNLCKPCFHFFIQKRPNFEYQCKLKKNDKFSDKVSYQMGLSAEQKFYNLCMIQGFLIRPSSSYENRVSHYDFVIGISSHSFLRVEVKSMKARRRGEMPDPSVIYLELKNIDGGPGWIYGESDYIAFEQPRGFILYPNREIVEYVEKYAPTLPFVTQSGIDFTLYGRPNRKDIVMVIPFAEFNYRMSHRIYL